MSSACRAALVTLFTALSARAVETTIRPNAVVVPVGPADARWTGGLWKHWADRTRDATVPQLARLMGGTEPSQYLVNFRVAAGTVEGRHRGAPFNDGDFYKWLEAATVVGVPVDDAVAAIRQAQRPDGYLHTRVQIRAKQGEDVAAFRDPLQFEAYNLGHLMTAACVRFRLTGRDDLLDAAKKAADFLDRQPPTPQFARCAICPAHYMGLVELYRTTREPRYLALAKRLIDLRDRVPDGTDDNQDRIPFRKQTKAMGHAVRANYLYAGAADLYAETGDATLLAPLTAIWDDLTATKLAITGGCGALFDGASPDGSKDQKTIGRTHQAYGRDYQLPNATAHNETCASIGLALWAWRMLAITGDAKYADVLELVLLNAIPAGLSEDGTRFFYTNTLRQLDRMPTDLRWSRARQTYFGSFCCPPNVARTLAETHTYAYGVSDRGLWVHLYGSSEVATAVGGTAVRLTQTTDYPWDGRVRIKVGVAPATAFALRLRVPGWAGGATLAVNGRPLPAPEAGRYAVLDRTWLDGDEVTLTLPMAAKLIESHPLVEETRNHVAVKRGPLVYCLESADLPKGVSLQDVAVPAGFTWTPAFDAKLLGGVATLAGRVEARPTKPWGRELYREATPAAATPADVRLVPYFAWANRGPSEMSVWLPVGR
ncbi:MAG: glycoside hydrolase family 127 protein [Gemmataceae bacterium]